MASHYFCLLSSTWSQFTESTDSREVRSLKEVLRICGHISNHCRLTEDRSEAMLIHPSTERQAFRPMLLTS